MELVHDGERVDDLQRSGLHIIQDPAGFCFGMDAVLLAGYAAAPAGGRVLDLGTGTGIVPLLMSARTRAAQLTGLELQAKYADMAARSVALNRLEERISIVEGDIRRADAIFAPASFDVVTSNPPYMTAGRGLVNPRGEAAAARHELFCTFDDVARAAEKLLRGGGHLYLVHRPQRLPELMTTLRQHRLEPKRMRLVYPYLEAPANMVLLDCTKDGRPELKVEKPLIIYQAPGVYREEILEWYGY